MEMEVEIKVEISGGDGGGDRGGDYGWRWRLQVELFYLLFNRTKQIILISLLISCVIFIFGQGVRRTVYAVHIWLYECTAYTYGCTSVRCTHMAVRVYGVHI